MNALTRLSTFKLTVSKACLQEWSTMQPKDNGRHCTSCETTVIDFSKMSDEEVANFFLLNNREPVCGRFKAAQLERIEIVVPAYFFEKRIPLWKKYLLLLLVCFATDILPGNVIFKINTGLYAQSVATVKKKKTKHRNAKKKTKPKDIIIAMPEMMILGYTQTICKEELLLKPAIASQKPLQNIIQPDGTAEENKKPGEKRKNSRLIFTAALPQRRRKSKLLHNQN